MSISFQCTGCGRTLKVADELAGRKAKCPQCQTVLYIPEGPAVAMTPAPAPARRHAAPAPPPPEEYDDRADPGAAPGEEEEGGPRRRKKAKKSPLVPILVAVVALLVLIGGGTVAAIFVVPMIFGGGNNDDLLFMPNGTQMVGQIREDQIMNSDALKQVYATFPDLKTAVDQANKQSSAISSNDVERMYFGVAAVSPGSSAPPNAIGVLHLKKSVKVEDIEDLIKKSVPIYTFTFADSKVGKYTMYEVKMTAPSLGGPLGPKGAPPAPALPQSMGVAFAMPDDKRVVVGATSVLQAVLTRDKAPDLSDKLKAAIKQTDFNATIAFAADLKGAVPMPSGGASPINVDKVDGLSVAIKIASDIDVNVTAICKDSTAAGELSGGLKTAIAGVKMQYAKNAPPEVADLMDVTPQANGSNVTITKTIKVAPLLKLAKSQMQGLPANPFMPFGK